MNKRFKRISLIIAICLNPVSVNATGIPTVDLANLLQNLEQGIVRVQEFKQRIDQAKSQMNHYKDMVEGHYNFEDLINDPSISKALALDDWKELYDQVSNVDDLREEFNLYSDNPVIQAKYDSQLKAFKAKTNFYNSYVKRNNNLQNLVEQFKNISNPAAKEDLANAISLANVQIKNDEKMMESMENLMDQEAILEANKQALIQRKKIQENNISVDYSSAYDN